MKFQRTIRRKLHSNAPTSQKEIANKYKLSLERNLCVDSTTIRLDIRVITFRSEMLCLFYSSLLSLHGRLHRTVYNEQEGQGTVKSLCDSIPTYSIASFILDVLFQRSRASVSLLAHVFQLVSEN